MHQFKTLALGYLLLVMSVAAQGQLSGGIGVDVGQVTTQFGGSSITYAKRNSAVFGITPVLTLAGSNDRNTGWTVSAGGDLRIPSDRTDATGNPTEYAGNISVDFRVKFMGLGAGFEGREFILPSDPTYVRPNQLLLGIPLHYKVTFGPHSAAYAQFGITGWFHNVNQNMNSTNTQTITINGIGTAPFDYKATAGYVFGSKHTGIRVSYIRRNVTYNVAVPGTQLAGSSRPAIDPRALAPVGGFQSMDFRQNQITGGLVFIFH